MRRVGVEKFPRRDNTSRNKIELPRKFSGIVPRSTLRPATPSSYVAAFLLRTIPLTFINVSKSRKYNLARLVVGSADATIHPSGLPFFFSLSFSLFHTFLFLVLSLSIFLYLPLSFVVSILEIEILPRWKKATSKRFGGTPALDFPDYVRVNVILRRYQQLERTWRG